MKCNICITSPRGHIDEFSMTSESYNEIETYVSGRFDEVVKEWFESSNLTSFDDFYCGCDCLIQEVE